MKFFIFIDPPKSLTLSLILSLSQPFYVDKKLFDHFTTLLIMIVLIIFAYHKYIFSRQL